ncbi:MAG: hypothetical protein ACYC91_12770 [Solirubrobacteraceae bacterium]
MLLPAAAFSDVVIAVHVMGVMIAFGAVFAYPLFVLAAERFGRSSMPVLHRLQQLIGRRLINPGLGVVLLAGIYLASDLHQWKHFYVQWGLAITIVLGGLEGAVMIRGEGRLAELAERDLGTGDTSWSAEYLALRTRLGAVGALMIALVLITIYLMTVQA